MAPLSAFARDVQALRVLTQRSANTLQGQANRLAARVVAGSKAGATTYFTAIGKSAFVAQRGASSLRSLSIPASFCHVSEWGHGCLGGLRDQDLIIVMSNSGTTRECLAACKLIRKRRPACDIAGIFSDLNSEVAPNDEHLSMWCQFSLEYPLREVQELEGGQGDLIGGRCPTTSIILQESCVNQLLSEVVALSKFSEQDFKENHPN
mmetsp:Transcript_13963/g.24953  ORF Transcript_13963/g.24953 Transcript_13963/m.24953 type:complete len:207 (-) Transcript_13963:120-740(-)